jgi:hypothetical protein
MSKRLMLRLALVIAALSATTLLQGCGGDDDDLSYSFVWVSGGSMGSSGASVQMSSAGPTW